MRITWIKLHLIVASFFSLALLLMAISGGGYLLGFKGTTTTSVVPVPDLALDLGAETVEQDVRAAFLSLGIDHDFDYLRMGGSVGSGMSATTRPTSETYYVFDQSADGLTLTKHDPDLQKVLVELHKGHGPEVFRIFQQVMAASLLFILLTGLWLGISSKGLRNQTAVSAIAGVLVFLLLAFVA